jgi:beta-glucosidase
MTRYRRSIKSLSIALALTAFALPVNLGAQNAETISNLTRPRDSEVEKRADNLLGQMTTEEKIGQLSQIFVFGPSRATEERIRAGKLGSVLFVTNPAQINRLQHAAVDGSRLHIPLLFGLDVIHGFRTIFPVPIGMVASWDPAMVEKAQSVAAEEARAAGIHWTFGPMVDIARDPRWGRIVEGAGEDPYLGSAMAVAQVRGFQGPYLGAPNHIVACAKHFAGYGAAEGGRDYDAANISDEQLWNVYLPPFKSAVDSDVGTVMSAYMDLNGVPATGNRWLLTNVLRDQWHFQGFVVSDANAVNDLKTRGSAKDSEDAAVRALTAGVDMEMALGSPAYSATLPEALETGRITKKQLDAAVRLILETKFRLNLFEHPYADEAAATQVINTSDHRTEALHSAERSAVLLRNEGGLLPLQPSRYNTIAVLGPLADSKADTIGSWVFANDASETVPLIEALQRQAGSETHVEYAQGVQIARKFPSPFDALLKGKKPAAWSDSQAAQEFANAVQLAERSDLVIMVLGEAQSMSGESASTSSLELPGKQEQSLESVVASGKPVVLVLMNGRPLDITWASEHVPAILEAWYPGTQGGNAIVDLLYGKSVPGGKLPFTWPRNVGQIPIFYAHNTTQAPTTQNKRYWNEESTPLYPFGFGLSYANFGFSNLHLSGHEVKLDESLNVSVDVENTSDVPGDQVVQLYLHQQFGTSSRPVRELKGFRRVPLSPHQKKTVQFTLTKEDRAYWSSATMSWINDVSSFDVWVGGDSTASLHDDFATAP